MFLSSLYYSNLNYSKNYTSADYAFKVFKETKHTYQSEPTIPASGIKEFVYFRFPNTQVFSTDDWKILNRIHSIALLFSKNADSFEDGRSDDSIDYFSTCLQVDHSDRSTIAHDAHAIISRLSSSNFTVVLFEVNEEVMLSFAIKDHAGRSQIILSDWYSLDDMDNFEIQIRLDATYYSYSSVLDYFYDFQYSMARDYYIYPISYDYAYYQMMPRQLKISENIDIVTRDMVNDIAQENYNAVIIEYKDDYVGEYEFYNNMAELNTDDVDLELFALELELIEKENLNDVEESDDDLDDETIDYKYEVEKDFDKQLFNDAVKMVEWLKKHSE